MRQQSPATGQKRKGVILLVVLAMITLLTVLGLTFVLYSDASEATARINMEGERSAFQVNPIDYPAYELMQHAFGQLVFGVEDDDIGQQSAIRGHELARDIYGYRYSGPAQSSSDLQAGNQTTSHIVGQNDRPFRGTGRLRVGGNDSDKLKVNFTTFKNYAGGASPEYIRDPERPGTNGIRSGTDPNSYFGGFNPPYTFADLNHVFLAKLGPDGQVDEPSFVRRDSLNTKDTTTYPGPLAKLSGNTFDFNFDAWTNPNPEWKYRHVRPRKNENSPAFPEPGDAWGDVRNLPWGTHNDAVWIDLGVAPKTAPSGKKYKPLFAFTILDLDGRVNVNAHGNIHGRNPTSALNDNSHASRHGGGSWEVSLEKALALYNQPLSATDNQLWKNAFSGFRSTTGKFSPNGSIFAPSQNLNPALDNAKNYAPTDFNAGAESPIGTTNISNFFPGAQQTGIGSPLSSFSAFIQQVYGNNSTLELVDTRNNTLFSHAAFYNQFLRADNSISGNKVFSDKQLGLLMAKQLRNSEAYKDSELYKLNLFSSNQVPNNPFVSIVSRDPRYDRLTTMSWDLDRPGMVPYLSNTDRASFPLTLTPSSTWVPSAGRQPFIPNGTLGAAFSLPATTQDGEFDSSYQSTLALSKKLNLRRKLAPYPSIDTTAGVYDPANPNLSIQLTAANDDRQKFASDIYNILVGVTGADSSVATYSNKWLAQVAVNLVDNIDEDEVITAFTYTTGQTVFGTELQKIVINEIFPQIENDPQDISRMASQDRPSNDFILRVFVELLNPLYKDPIYPDSNKATLKNGAGHNVHIIEQVSITDICPTGDLRELTSLVNSSGALVGPPLNMPRTTNLPSWTSGNLQIAPPNPTDPNHFKAPNNTGLEKGYFVVGPDINTSSSDLPGLASRFNSNNSKDCIEDASLKSWTVPKTTTSITSLTGLPVLLLRRLADPYQPPSVTNPYVTIDFVQITPDMFKNSSGKANDARKQIQRPGMMGQNNTDLKSETDRVSFNKPQPFVSIPMGIMSSDGSATAVDSSFGSLRPQPNPGGWVSGPKTTFWRYNGQSDAMPASYVAPGIDTFETPFFRNHLDRAPLTVGEILTTSTCRPHEYQLFNNKSADYCAGWLSPQTRMYRFLEMVQAGDTRLASFGGNTVSIGSEGGRVPGKINVNTMSYEVFQALCDANPNNAFTAEQVYHIWWQLQAGRPYWGFGMGDALSATGDLLSGPGVPRGITNSLVRQHSQTALAPPINNTLSSGLPISTSGPPQNGTLDSTDLLNLMFDPQNGFNNPSGLPNPLGTSRYSNMDVSLALPPTVRLELLSKIMGNSTTRSNCFAVWVTVGFFEVVSEDGIPGQYTQKYILGKELQPRARKRFFSLIDRTQLEVWSKTVDSGRPSFTGDVSLGSLGLGSTLLSPVTGKTYPIIPSNAGSGIQATILTINPGTFSEETVEVEDIPMIGIGIRLKNTHTVPFQIINRGNPGPIPREKMDLDDFQRQGLIPYFQVLE